MSSSEKADEGKPLPPSSPWAPGVLDFGTCRCPCNRKTPEAMGVPREHPAAARRCHCTKCGHKRCHVRMPATGSLYCFFCTSSWCMQPVDPKAMPNKRAASGSAASGSSTSAQRSRSPTPPWKRKKWCGKHVGELIMIKCMDELTDWNDSLNRMNWLNWCTGLIEL